MIPAVLDHLWQSTVVALAVALLMPVFRKASAGVRYGLWFAASMKFVVPFAALAALGRLLAPAGASPVGAAPEAMLIAKATQPFSQVSLSQFPFARSALLQAAPSPVRIAHGAASAVHSAPHLDLGLILLAAWALGCIAVLARWMVRWTRLRAAVRLATPLPWSAPMAVLASPLLLEPGLIGLWRPILLVPQSLPDHLGAAEIDAILAHETCHLRRRDNLTAALHMLVEALFWFHPLTWWIGARLIEEREQACDEAVVRAGHDRAAYARSLLESARLYLESPLSCVAGASGSNLKTRVETIMTAPLSSPLSRFKKALLLAAGSFALATPVAAGLLTPPDSQPAAAPANILATMSAPAPSIAALPKDQTSTPAAGPPLKPIVLAQNRPALAPALSVAAVDTTSAPLARQIAAPQIESSLPAGSTSATPVAPPPTPGDAKAQALDFVQSYAASSPKHDLIARWAKPICVRVGGLAPAQSAAVGTRIEEVALAAGATVQQGGCRPDVQIEFTLDPQRLLDETIAKRAWVLGHGTSDTTAVKTMTHPIQAWYLTNGVDFAANGADGLKALVLYQGSSNYFTTGPGAPGNAGVLGGQPGAFVGGVGGATPYAGPRQFLNVWVMIDLRRTDGVKLGPITDYVAMLVLSRPRSLDHCNVLPSVTDLFADACAGRAAPERLTSADAAYLTALYTGPRSEHLPHFANQPGAGNQHPSDVAERMARILAEDKVATR